MSDSVIDCRDLLIRYGELVAVDHLWLQAEPGRVLAILGPNGAGKTSTVETLEGYRRPSSGEVRVLGHDPVHDHVQLVAHIGVMLQHGGIYPTMGPLRVLELFSRYYEEAEDPKELLELVGLATAARTPWKRLSGGEQQRLALALALVGRPAVLFLDEPTAGVDPEGRLSIREIISAQRDRGVCVVLSTHELPEAERLADEVLIISHGRAVARGTVAELAEQSGEGGIHFSAPEGIDVSDLAKVLEVADQAVTQQAGGHYSVKAPATSARVAALATWLADNGLPLTDLRAGHRSLEDVYLRVTRSAAFEVQRPTNAGSLRRTPPAARRTGRAGASLRLRLAVRRTLAHAAAEVEMTLRRGESLLLTIGIPAVLLAFFSEVHILPVGTASPVGFLAPGVLALAVMGTAMVNLSIATGFERGYGVLKRLGSTPLGRPSILASKIASVLVVEALQAAVLVPVALGLGWHPSAAGAGTALGLTLLATAGFAGVGLALAGTLRAEVNLAAANGLWLVLLLVSGMLAPLSKLPGWLQALAKALPAAGLAQGLHSSLTTASGAATWSWVALIAWAVSGPAVAALVFRWE